MLLLPVFFAFTGLRTQVGLLGDAHDWIIGFVDALFGASVDDDACALAARLRGMDTGTSLHVGALLYTRGLMELIALNIGYDLGILSQRIFTMLVLMALITTVMTGPLLTLFGKSQRALQESQLQKDRLRW